MSLIPIVAGYAPDQPARLWMRTSFQVRLDDSREHLAVVRSVFALVIDRGSKRPECELSTTETKATSPPPPSFSGGGKWEAMHDDMAGYFEVRVQGGGMNPGSSASWSAR